MFGLSEERIKVIVLSKLRDRGCWGARYMPVDTLVNWLSKKVKKDGRRVRKAVRSLIQDGYILLHKKGKAISLNPRRSREIIGLIRRHRT